MTDGCYITLPLGSLQLVGTPPPALPATEELGRSSPPSELRPGHHASQSPHQSPSPPPLQQSFSLPPWQSRALLAEATASLPSIFCFCPVYVNCANPGPNFVCSDETVHLDINGVGQQAEFVKAPYVATEITITNSATEVIVDAARVGTFTITTSAKCLLLNLPSASVITVTANSATTMTLLAATSTVVTYTANALTSLNYISPTGNSGLLTYLLIMLLLQVTVWGGFGTRVPNPYMEITVTSASCPFTSTSLIYLPYLFVPNLQAAASPLLGQSERT